MGDRSHSLFLAAPQETSPGLPDQLCLEARQALGLGSSPGRSTAPDSAPRAAGSGAEAGAGQSGWAQGTQGAGPVGCSLPGEPEPCRVPQTEAAMPTGRGRGQESCHPQGHLDGISRVGKNRTCLAGSGQRVQRTERREAEHIRAALCHSPEAPARSCPCPRRWVTHLRQLFASQGRQPGDREVRPQEEPLSPCASYTPTHTLGLQLPAPEVSALRPGPLP